jgi:Domain of unknown function (DUF4400)
VTSNTSFDDSVVARVLLKPFKFAFALTRGLSGLLLVASCLHWFCVEHLWSGRTNELRALISHELTVGSGLAARQGLIHLSPTDTANGLYAVVFKATGFHEAGQRFADGSPLSIPDTVLRRTWIARHEEIQVAMMTTQLLGLRAGILVRFVPLVVLLYAVGSIEGLSRRAIRRAQVARESASLYHRAKLGQVGVAAVGISLALIWPAPVSWAWCALVSSTLMGVLATAQWGFYKKHV